MKNKISVTLKIISTVMTCVILVLAILLVGVKLFGIKVYTVLSGSMEPEYPTGALIYVKEVEPEELKVKDVITYELAGNNVATHRIVGIREEAGEFLFTTKGDANSSADNSPVRENRIVGKVIFKIPGLGRAANFIQSTMGIFFIMLMGAVIFLLMAVADYLSDKKKTGSR